METPEVPAAPKKERKVVPWGAAQKKLDKLGLEKLCQEIMEPKSMQQICQEIGIAQGSMVTWIAATAERSARVREARIATARMWEEKATTLIEAAKDKFELEKARDLAHHYRWRASKIAPREYGDKMAIGGTDELPAIVTKSTLDVSALPTEVLAALMKAKDASQ